MIHIKACIPCGNIFTADACYCTEYDSKWLEDGGEEFCGMGLTDLYFGSYQEYEQWREDFLKDAEERRLKRKEA